jgi:hypothetical protein
VDGLSNYDVVILWQHIFLMQYIYIMYYASSITGIFFILVGLCFLAISTRVRDYWNKSCFFSFGLLTLFLGAYPLMISDADVLAISNVQ